MAQMDFDIQFWKQCYSVKHDWRNFSYVPFQSILIIVHEIYMIIVIHPKTCSQHSIVSGFCFFLGRTVHVEHSFEVKWWWLAYTFDFATMHFVSSFLSGVREKAFERMIRNTCETVLLASLFPRSSVDITIQEIQDAGAVSFNPFRNGPGYTLVWVWWMRVIK